MASGITIPDEIRTLFNDMKLNKSFKYAILKLSEDFKELLVEETVKDGTFDELRAKLKAASDKQEGRFVIYDHDRKLFLITWSDDNSAKIKQKMVLASTKKSLCSKLAEGFTEVTINDFADLNENTLNEKKK